MEGMIIVDDVLSEDCTRKLHVMSNAPIRMKLPDGATAEDWTEAGVYHLRAEWMFTGMIDFQFRHWPQPRRFLVWALRDGEKVSDAIRSAAEMWTQAVGWEPLYAWVRSLPEKAKVHEDEWGIILVHDLILLAAEWMPSNCVAVGGRR
jgi:hypothetical protein